jgi:hypothetical protein
MRHSEPLLHSDSVPAGFLARVSVLMYVESSGLTTTLWTDAANSQAMKGRNEMDIDKLIPVRMKQDDMKLTEIQAFRCGSQPHETPLAEWIKLHSAGAIACRHKVWLYRLQNEKGPLVGFGSLANGKINTTEQDGSERVVKGYEIPMLALHEDFWGKPKGVSLEGKYSRQIVRHLQAAAREAQKNTERERLLALYVHPDATLAQSLYVACGFVFAPNRFLPDPDIPPEQAPGLLGMDYIWS